MNVGTILWAGNRADHYNHLHVEPDRRYVGYTDGRGVQPPTKDAGMTVGLAQIYATLVDRFGPTKYFENPGRVNWTHMGIYNRRPIAGSARWSQHAYSNAIDIGPYYGVKDQQKFYDFLTGKDHNMPSEPFEVIAGIKWYDVDKWSPWADASIRANIVAGIIRGKEYKDGRKFDPQAGLTREEAAVLLDRIDVV